MEPLLILLRALLHVVEAVWSRTRRRAAHTQSLDTVPEPSRPPSPPPSRSGSSASIPPRSATRWHRVFDLIAAISVLLGATLIAGVDEQNLPLLLPLLPLIPLLPPLLWLVLLVLARREVEMQRSLPRAQPGRAGRFVPAIRWRRVVVWMIVSTCALLATAGVRLSLIDPLTWISVVVFLFPTAVTALPLALVLLVSLICGMVRAVARSRPDQPTTPGSSNDHAGHRERGRLEGGARMSGERAREDIEGECRDMRGAGRATKAVLAVNRDGREND